MLDAIRHCQPKDRQASGATARRHALLRSSALQAAALAALGLPAAPAALAQTMPAPTQLPTGGKVFTGAAAIASRGATLTVDQASRRAGINWQSFSIGSQATVAIHTPGAQALTINRVVGPDPSVIAGRLSSNGQVVITNQSGVTFTQGAQVNVQSLIASAPGISEANAKAGRLVFDQPARAGAAVVNRGTITVGQTGLAALVAPQVVNAGAIRAHLGKVVLAGAAAHTVDLYGDGLLSIDVSRQVTTVPVGPDGKPATALVTNTGTILANGGTVVLTAKAVDGLVTTLVDAGGTISAPTSAGRAGRIVIAGTGGDVILRGVVAARGTADGEKGGRITVNAPGHAVMLTGTAVVDASGRAGGGAVAVGTTLARARGGPSVSAPTAKHVAIAEGARLAADATGRGNGGIVTVLSKGGATLYQGEISARGGPLGGDGGAVEVSGDYLALAGSVNVLAPMGAAGSVLLDPNDIEIVADGTAAPITLTNPYNAPSGTTTLDYTQINQLSGNVTLTATGSITVSGALDLTAHDSGGNGPHTTGLAMLANGNITINAAVTGISGIILSAGATFIPSGGTVASAGSIAAALAINAPVTSTGSGTIALGATGGGIAINAAVASVGGTVNLLSTGGVTEAAGGTITAATLIGIVAGGVSLPGTANAIGTLGDFTVNAGDFALADSTPLVVSGTVSAINVALGDSAAGAALTLSGPVTGTGTVALATGAGALTLDGVVSAATLDLNSAAGITQGGGSLSAGTLLSSSGVTGDVTLDRSANTVDTLAGFAVTSGGFTLRNGAALAIAGTLAATSVAVTDAASVAVSGTVTAASGGITITSDRVGFDGKGALDAGGGVVALLPVSGAAVVALGGGGGGASGIAPGDLSQITAGTIMLGGTGSTGTRAASITLAGHITTTATLALHTSGTIEQTGGTLSVGALTGSASGVTIARSGNAIPVLGAFTAGSGDFTLADDVALVVSGTVSAANVALTNSAAGTALAINGAIAGTGTVALTASAGALALAGVVDAGAGTLDLAAPGGITQSGGSLVAGTLLSTDGVSGDVTLGSTGNRIATLGDFAVTKGGFALADSAALTIAGTLGATSVSIADSASGTALALSGSIAGAAFGTIALTTSAGGITLNGAASAGVLDLGSVAGISQGGGSLVATTLLSSAGVTGDVALGGTKNAIANLSDFIVTGGGFALTAGSSLTVSGIVAVDSGRAIALTTDHASFALGTKLDAGTGTVSLIPLTGGAVLALSGTEIANLAAITAGTISLGGAAGGGGTQAGSIDIASYITSSAVLELHASGAITQSAGTLGVAGLRGSAASVSIERAGNAIPVLGDFTVKGGDFALNDGVSLNVTGTVSAADLRLRAPGLAIGGGLSATGTAALIATGGGIALGGTVSAATVDLGATAGIVQSGGSITAGLLQSSFGVTGDVNLGSAGNAVGGLGGFAVTAGAFTLTGSGALTVSGPLSATSVTLVSGALGITGSVVASGTASLVASAGALTIGGTVAGGSAVVLDGAAGISETGTLTSGRLSGDSASGGASLTGSNTITTLGDFTVAADFALKDAAPLTVSGTVSGAGIMLASSGSGITINAGATIAASGTASIVANAGSIALQGALTGTKAVALDAAIGVSGAGVLTAGTLAGSAPLGGVALGGANRVAALGDFTASSGFQLADTTGLTVIGTVAAASIDLSVTGGGIALSGVLNASGPLSLAAAGGITQGGGALVAGTLLSGGGVTGDVVLASATNRIGALGGFAVSGGDFTLTDSISLSVAGLVSVGSGRSVTLTGDALGFAAGGTLAASGGLVTLAPLTGAATVTLGGTTGGIAVGDLGGITAGTISLGGVAGGGGIEAASIALTGNATTAAALELHSSGTIVQSAGTLSVGSLSGDASGVAIEQPGNVIPSLGTFTLGGGDFRLADSVPLTIAGTLSASNVALADSAPGSALVISGDVNGTGTVALTAGAGALALDGVVTAGTLDLNARGGIVQGGGSLVAATLLSGTGVTGDVVLTSATNRIGRLGGFAVSGGDFRLADSVALTVAGGLSAGDVALSDTASGTGLAVTGSVSGTGTVALTAGAGALTLDGAVTAGTLSLAAAGGITQGGGALVAGTLLSGGGVTGDVVLASATNRIGALGGFAVSGGDFTLTDSISLSVAGLVSVGSGRSVTLTGDALGFAAGGTLAASGGLVTLAPLTGAATVTLGGTTGGIAVGDLGGITAGTISLGGVAGGGGIEAASIALTGNATTAAALELHSSGTIVQSAGTLSVGSLSGDASGVAIEQPGNVIPSLGTFTLGGGDFRLADSVPLTIAIPLSAANVALSDSAPGSALVISSPVSATGTVALTASVGALVLGDVITAATLDLNAAGGITQSGGSLVAATLLSSTGVTGDVVLTSATNRIGRLGGFAVSGGDFRLADSVALTVAGAVSAANVTLADSAAGTALTVSGSLHGTGTVALVASAGTLALGGVVTAATLDLAAPAGITQGGGSLIAGTLLSSAGVTGDVMLASATNRIGALGRFVVSGGDFRLADSVPLTIAGTLSASNVALADSAPGSALVISGDVNGTGTVALTAGAGALALDGVVTAATLDLNARGGIVQGGGSLVAATLLSGTGVTGDVVLTSATNRIGRLGGFAVSGGDFRLADSVALTVAGGLSAGDVALSDTASGTGLAVTGSVSGTGTVALTAGAGALTLDGAVTAGTLDLAATGGITQGGGALVAGTLLSGGGVTGDVVLASPTNRIGALGGFAVSGGDFTLTDGAALTIAGALGATNITLADSATGTALTVSGPVNGTGTVALSASAGALALDGVITAGTLDLAAAGGITQGGGALVAGTLLSSAGVTGNVALDSAGNRVSTLGAFTVSGGDLTFADATPLSLTAGGATPAQVRAHDFTLTMTGAGSAGNVVITGAVIVPGTLNVATGGTIGRSGSAAFVVGTLTGSAVTLADFGTAANLGTLGAFTVTGSEFALGNAQPLTITGPLSAEYFRITATGSMILAGNVTTLGETRAEQGLGNLGFSSADAALATPFPVRGSYFAVLPDGQTEPSFIQSGPVTITTTGGALSTLRIQTMSDTGTITLADLTAPTTDLLLFPGRVGVIHGTGRVDLGGLLVVARGGKSDLTGTIGAIGGEAAAHLAGIAPLPDSSYRFNSCPISSINCLLTPVGVLPPPNPLQDFVIGEVRGDEGDLDLILPNVADEDY